MNAFSGECADFSGQFVWCTKLHEDQLSCIDNNVPQQKSDGTQERIDIYRVPGKRRPALVLQRKWDNFRKLNYLIVWYTCTSEGDQATTLEVTRITRPPSPKRSFLLRRDDDIRWIPYTTAWCGRFTGKMDPTVFDGLLKTVQRFPVHSSR